LYFAHSGKLKTMPNINIETFVDQLARSGTDPDATNQYLYGPATNAIRRANLGHYLEAMTKHKPETLLVMEAPGYRGCRLTGVPVTSRKILLDGLPELDVFGAGYQDVPEPGFEHIQGEQSATIVWGTLRELGVVPLIWNTFPFHPHRMNAPLTNRKPRKPETALGMTFLRDIIDWFGVSQIIAVGNVAHDTLRAMDIHCDKVRHPAQGGKNDFVAGLNALLG
jgi:hypothetical protein